MPIPAFVTPLIMGLSAAATAGGAVAKSQAAKKAQMEASRAKAAEALRQRQIQEEARRRGLESLKEFEPEEFKNKEEAIAGRQLDQVAQLISENALPKTFTSSSAPDVINRASDKAKARGQASADLFGKNLADFGAQTGALSLANLKASQGAQDVSRFGRDAEISAALTANQLQGLQGAGGSLLGEVLGGVGQAGLSASLSGALQPVPTTTTGSLPVGTGTVLRPTPLMNPNTATAGLDPNLMGFFGTPSPYRLPE
jgi:hypothetical protein